MEKIILETKNLNIFFNKKQILKSINLQIHTNKITAIIGSSGCGKSTLLKALNKSIEEYGAKVFGDIYFENKNICDMDINFVRKSIGMVYQAPVVFPFSIYKNMTYAAIYHGENNKKKLDEIIKMYLEKAGLYDEVKDSLNMQANMLSGGQQQRLTIARCLSVNPKIILLDEPCSALDIKNTSHIEKMLKNIKDEYTIVIVTHNLAQAKRIADYIIYMDDGKVIEYNTTNELFTNPKEKLTKEYIDYMNVGG